MTYRELQKQLKTLRENGKDVKVKLNSKKVILEKELARLHELKETNSVGKEEVLPLQEKSDLAESFSGGTWCKRSNGSWLSSAHYTSTIMDYRIDKDSLTLSPPYDYTKILALYPRL